jgi:hypothetical protein
MQDIIQELANKFCAEFRLAPTRIEFAIGFTRKTLNIYNFLLTPKDILSSTERRWEFELSKFAEKGRHDAMKDYLWREIAGTRMKGYVSQIEAKDVRILRAAIEICENKKPALAGEELKTAQEIAGRIRKFHAQGKAIKEFKGILALATAEVGKMPLLEAKLSDVEYYLHEAIHYILRANRLYTNSQPFNEGLCSFLHMRFRGKFRTFGMYHLPTGRSDYMRWAKFFLEKFAKTPNEAIGAEIRKNINSLLGEFKQRF